MSPQPKQLLFIYGTLKRGHSRASNLEGQEFLGESKTLARYRMYNCGTYPGLVEAENGLEIIGEVWSVDPECLRRLDLVEAVDSGLYQRKTIELLAPFDSEPIVVESYFYLLPVDALADCGDCWNG